ncbi:MAG: tRNA epoxyqueuosine(34) reductase QueG [Acidobacteriota bacterium]|jgi:epoxyqueuosine reductase
MNVHALTRRVKERALALGFTAVGIAPVGRSPREAFYRAWLAGGNHGEMAYLARQPGHRTDPRRVLPGATSAVCVTLDYHPVIAGRRAEGEGIVPLVSTYARNLDYHEVMGPRLRSLLEFLRDEAGAAVDGRAYVDTGPVLERDLGAAAGLGWVGRNTQLLDRRGSWFFLGEILVDVELVPDSPVEDRCGTCTACIDACPTGALRGDYVLDARRCISYLNIELRGPIPREHRTAIRDELFGCDICQDVCPWNQRALPAVRPEFAPRESLRGFRLEDLLGLDAEGFARAFRRSPLKRPKRRGLLRTAAVILGNRGDREAVTALARSLDADPEPQVRSHAAWALGRLGGTPARTALDHARRGDADPAVREEAGQALDR